VTNSPAQASAVIPPVKRQRRWVKPVLFTAGAVIVLLSGGTAVLAATTSSPVGPGGVIHGCYATAGTNGTHSLVLQNTGSSCPAGDTAIKWSKQGPAGPPGPPGPATAGPGGLGVTVVSSNVTYLNSDGTISAAAFCPNSAPYVIGGPAVLNTNSEDIAQSAPYDFTTNSVIAAPGTAEPETSGDQYGWRASAAYLGAPAPQFTVTAICSA
jgi:hypothetical protein